MIYFKYFTIAAFFGLISLAFLINITNATTLSMALNSGEEINRNLDLKIDDRVNIQFKVLGTENNFISFSLLYPNATEIDFGEVTELNHNFICDMKGQYTMNFINNDTTDSKLVTLNYKIEPYMFGMPHTLFLVLLIVAVSIAMVAIYAMLSPPM